MGLSSHTLIEEAGRLAAREWTEPEQAWSALARTYRYAGDLRSSVEAWTHPEGAYRFEDRGAICDTAIALRRAGCWGELERLLQHIGPGHDQATVLSAVMDDALDRDELGPAIHTLWWIPESLREDALLHAIDGLVAAGDVQAGWAVEALWDGLLVDGGGSPPTLISSPTQPRSPTQPSTSARASRARARALLGDEHGARALLAPLLVDWLSPRPSTHPNSVRTASIRHATIALTILGDLDGAIWCMRRLNNAREECNTLRQAAFRTDKPHILFQDMIARWGSEPSQDPKQDPKQETAWIDAVLVHRVVGALEVVLGQVTEGRSRLRDAAVWAAGGTDFYHRRLALQEIAHAQVVAGDIEAALQTARKLSRPRFGYEHIAAAALVLQRVGADTEAEALLQRLPPGRCWIMTACRMLVLREQPSTISLDASSDIDHPMGYVARIRQPMQVG